jgi:hypothetical protein
MTDRTETRVGRRNLERRPVGERWRDVRGVGLIVLFLSAATVLLVLAAARLVGPFAGLGAAAPGGVDQLGRPITVDVPVENVVSRLPDGRAARGSFYLRMRQDAAPDQLVEMSRVTRPSPTPEAGPRPAGPVTGTSAESRVREAVNNAMSGLRYEEIVGEAGKEKLKSAVRDAVNGALVTAPVEQVYLKEYIVQ